MNNLSLVSEFFDEHIGATAKTERRGVTDGPSTSDRMRLRHRAHKKLEQP
jgi:hypothetical protein